MTWRPDDWEDYDPLLTEADWDSSEDIAEKCFEAGADAMHQADTEWLKDKIAVTPEGAVYTEKVLGGKDLICFRVLVEDWQAFKGGKDGD